MKTKTFTLICICAIFTVNLSYARWPQPDPHAENYYPQSPYSFAGNNPVNNVDPDGKDYYQSASGSVIWQDDNARRITIHDEKYKNIGSSHSVQMVDGSYANYYQGQFISTSTEAVNARQTVLENPGLAGALLSASSPLSNLSQQGLMTDMIHQAQGDFIIGAIDVGSSSLQTMGDALATTGYAASATGLGAEAGVPLVLLGNVMKYTGLGIESLMDYKRGNTRKVGYNAFTNVTMYGVGKLGQFAPGPYRAAFNLILTPFDAALSYGAGTINPQNRRR